VPGEAPAVPPEPVPLPDGGDRPVGHRAHPVERRDGGRATDPVGGEPGVALERPDRLARVVAEDPVLTPGVEAERVQPALQLEDVVAAHHRAAPVEEAVAEAVAALDQGRPGLAADDPVDPQPSRLLKRTDRAGRAVGVLTVRVRSDPVAPGGEAPLQVPHGLPAGARPQRRGHAAQATNSASS
jgi:hypothetical protein